MSSVFILGATGFIGGGVARALVTRGYNVTALARSEDKAKLLRKQEIKTVIGQAQDVKTWEKAALSADIIIEALADYQDHNTATVVQKALIDILSKHKAKTVIATSGVWIYGATSHLVDENSVNNPIDIVKGRPAWENGLLEAGAVILRPGVLYGYQGSITGSLFSQIKQGKGEFPGHANQDLYWSTVHLDDLSDAYVRTVEKASSLRGQIINVTSQAENVKDSLHAIAKVINFKGEIKFVEPKDPFSVALATSQGHIQSTKAKLVLGWSPKQPSFLSGIERYYQAWESFQ